MDNSISIFENSQFGTIRVVGDESTPLFVASDVASALGYYDTQVMTRRLDDDDKGMQIMRTLGGDQAMTVITESGLYNAVLGSKLSTAKEFKRWITHEVIPSIRKHGAYMTPETIESILANPDTIIQLATRLKEHQAEIAAQNQYIKALEPKAEFYDAVAGSKDAISIGDMAKVLAIRGIGRNNLFSILRDKKILDERNVPYQAFVDRGYFRVVEQKYTKVNGETKINLKTLVYQRGLDFVRKTVSA